MLSDPSPEVFPTVSVEHSLAVPQSFKNTDLDIREQALLTAKTEEFLPPLGLWTTLSGLVLLAGFAGAVAFASIAKYNAVVKAPAIVRPAGELRLVQAAMEGTVKQIVVQENQVVREGDAIAVLEDSQLQTKVSQLRGSIQQNQLQLAQIAAGLAALDGKITAETTAMQRSITSAQAQLSRNQRDYQDLHVSTETEVKEAKAALSLAQDELKRYRSLSESGAITQLQIKEKESAQQTAQARLERATSKLNPSQATVAIAQEQIALAQAQGQSTLATLRKEREALIQERLTVKSQIYKDQKDLKQLEIDQQKAIMRASATGTILKLELRNPGQFVRSGDAIAQIAPGQMSLLIKARVNTQDVANIKVCKASNIQSCREGKVFLRVSAYPYTDYGTLTGAVRAIAPDATTPGTNGATSAVPYYEVTIEPEKLYLERNDQQYPIQAGMDISAEIIAKEETILTFILRKARLLTNL
ncbi:HlyD family efflux transporter periplasmic adaptor subunit [Calothrix sp. FACHB-1219]|uniref:HlyD family secretion protein n=1 Tax=unclassified Calothrix TaxID=2619626 RepID=UPI001688632F|nr:MULTISPECIES: HlyD family efflux transporter periplasmic adaptor subunit [unclassified Calothrix]MBD2207476.1 HlyD family efflux transporter periplasmic adaptor subunit [Calothrix sp. FACHB-168]MBD2222028.1 HlyD family efflux transporter periplasmic adaptor subunit [Calothrix sp. FACHB-1219]